MVPTAPSLARAATIGLSFVGVSAILIWLVQPTNGGPAAADAASSVLYFDRIASGRHLEAWLNTTPKPLLTIVYGVLHAVDGQWRLVSLSAVLATAVGIVLAAEVVRRVAGLAAAAFALVALVGSVTLATEASWAYGLPWAFALWMAAALALLREPPRYGLAGTFLAVAGLARPESLILVGVATVFLVGLAVRGTPAPRRAWLITIGWLAIPVLCLHDLLLTGDPLWWLSVAPHAVEVNDGRARSIGGTLYLSASRVWAMNILAVEAVIGGLIVLWRRHWIATLGLIALGPLVIFYTWLLAVRNIQVLPHYLHPAELAIILGAAVGVGTLLDLAGARLATRVPRLRRPAVAVLVVAAGVVLAVVSSVPFTPLNGRAIRAVAAQGVLDRRVAALLPTIETSVSMIPPRAASDPGPMGSPDPSSVTLFVPRHRLPRMAVDLGLPLTTVAVLASADVDLTRGYPPVDSIVYMDGRIDPASVGPGTAVLRVTTATTVGSVRIVPLLTDPAAGIWIVRLEAAP